MDEAGLASLLAEHTGALSPAAGTPGGELDRARGILAIALLSGQAEAVTQSAGTAPPLNLDDLSAAETEDIRRVIHDALPVPRDDSVRIFRRGWPLLSEHVPSSVPAWARGWRPRQSLGPFESAEGRLVWFDVRRTGHAISVIESRSGRLLFTIPSDTLAQPPAMSSVTALELPAGSVWLAAARFDPSAPTGSLAGLRIRAGTVSFSEPALVHGDVITARPGVVATLHLRLDPGERLARARHGGDTRSLDLEVLDEARFAFHSGGDARIIRTATAHLGVYGDRVRLRLLEEARPRYDARLGRLWFPMKESRGSFSVNESSSRLLGLTGIADIAEAGWALPVTVPATPSTSAPPWIPVEAVGAGALAVALGAGIKAAPRLLAAKQPLALESVVLLAEHRCLSVVASCGTPRVRRALALWKGSSRRSSEINLALVDPLELHLNATAEGDGAEALSITPVECSADLDRPVTASARPIPFFSARGTLDIFASDAGPRLYLSAPAEPPRDPISGQHQPMGRLSIALSNALVSTSPALTLQVGGVLDPGPSLKQGVLTLDFALRFLMPSLPDPYAANIVRQAPRQLLDTGDAGRARLVAQVRWGAETTFSFALANRSDLGLAHGLMPLEEIPFAASVQRGPDYLREVEALFPRVTGQEFEFLRLLDVSTNADLFGVSLSGARESRRASAPLKLRGLDLQAPMRSVSAFTLPAFQWEPVYNIPAEGAPPFPDRLVSSTDGGPSRFAVPTATLVPLAPLPVVDHLLDEYNRNGESLAARFTLPFGMVAAVHMGQRPEAMNLGLAPRFNVVRPSFQAVLSSGLQLSLQAPPGLIAPLGGPSPGLPGVAMQSDNGAGGFNVLKSGFVDEMFNATFAGKMKMVPVRRVDFNGYGASVFSDWRHEQVQGAGVTQVRLEAIAGRASREVVQVKSRLYPWGVIVVRIITIERTAGGGVFRRDSGWQAASDGRYDLPGCVVHPGVVPRLAGIRRIRETSNVFERAYPGGDVKLTQVLFDADVEIEGVTLGADGGKLVPARDIAGYVQVLPVGADLTPEQVNDLLAATGPIGGGIDCELNVAQSGLHMRLSRIEVDRTLTLANNPQFVAVARGMPELARAGQWTFAYRGLGEPEWHRLASNQPLPLIRANSAGQAPQPHRVADASELHRPSIPHTEYGLLHSSGAQRLLIPQPQFRWGEATIHAGAALLFADMYALAGGVALFPRPDRCHPLPAGSTVRITGRNKVRLEVAPQPGAAPGEFKPSVGEYTLSQSATMRMRSRYAPNAVIRLVIDSDGTPDWSCTFGPVATLADIGDLEELTSVVGTMKSSTHAAPRLTDPHMVFGGPLAPVQTIISFLTDFGLPFPFDVQVTNQKYTFKSGWKYAFPEYGFGAIDKALKSGPGLMLEVELYGQWGKESEDAHLIGKEISGHSLVSTKGVPKGPDAKNWHFYFEAEAKLLARAIELGAEGFAGGALKVSIGGEEEGKTKLALFGGFAGVVELDSVAFKLKGGRSYMMGFEHLLGAKEVSLGVSSEWEVEGAFLDGLAAAKVSFEMLTLVDPPDEIDIEDFDIEEFIGEFHFKGQATLAIDVTLAWALSKTFEVEIDVDERIAAAVFVAMTVLPALA
jgi:hypothetical protein